jgi:polar amino acid transport system substrate-binding protein
MERSIRTAGALALVLLLATACGGGGTSPDELGLKTAGKLTVGSDIPYPPFEFNDESGKLVGFDVELVEAIAAKLGVEAEFVNAGFDTIFTALDGGQFDIVASSVTAYAPEGTSAFETVQERREIVAFSEPYYPARQSLTVDTEASADIKTTDDLPDGAKVGVQRGTTGQGWAKDNIGDRVELVTFPKAPQMFEALEGGALVGVVNDLSVALESIAERPTLAVVEQIDTGEEYGLAVQQDNPALLEAINEALKELFDDGTYATLFKKYFRKEELPEYATE